MSQRALPWSRKGKGLDRGSKTEGVSGENITGVERQDSSG